MPFSLMAPARCMHASPTTAPEERLVGASCPSWKPARRRRVTYTGGLEHAGPDGRVARQERAQCMHADVHVSGGATPRCLPAQRRESVARTQLVRLLNVTPANDQLVGARSRELVLCFSQTPAYNEGALSCVHGRLCSLRGANRGDLPCMPSRSCCSALASFAAHRFQSVMLSPYVCLRRS